MKRIKKDKKQLIKKSMLELIAGKEQVLNVFRSRII